MNYPIENLLKNQKIQCHEIRGTIYEGYNVLLHFFITQSKLDNALPEFKIGYEKYDTTSKDLEKDYPKPLETLIKEYNWINNTDTHSTLFNLGTDTNKNEWTGEQEDLLTEDNKSSNLSPHSAENVSVNKNLRYVSEMADNSIYSTDDIFTEKTYLATKDTSLMDTEALKEKSDNEKPTSSWSSYIHFNKFKHCSNEEALELFKKYKPYIGITIAPDLDTDSRLNNDMENLFGLSFDVVRIKNKLFSEATH